MLGRTAIGLSIGVIVLTSSPTAASAQTHLNSGKSWRQINTSATEMSAGDAAIYDPKTRRDPWQISMYVGSGSRSGYIKLRAPKNCSRLKFNFSLVGYDENLGNRTRVKVKQRGLQVRTVGDSILDSSEGHEDAGFTASGIHHSEFVISAKALDSMDYDVDVDIWGLCKRP